MAAEAFGMPILLEGFEDLLRVFEFFAALAATVIRR